MKAFIRKITVIVPVLFTLSCGLSGDMVSKMDEYNTELVVTVTAVTSSGATFNNDEFTVTITSSEPDITIKYTTDGTDPSRTNGIQYTGFVTINSPAGNVEIKAVVYDVNRISIVKSVTVSVGDGTPANPYEIATPVQLYNLSDQIVTYANSSFIQAADLDLSAYNTGTGWTPIGTSGTPFSGSYDGGSFTISNLFINNGSVDYQGLFGSINAPATAVTLENINLVNVNITGGNYTGSLAGLVDGTGAGVTITNCTVSGNSNITGTGDVGGLAGYLNNTAVSQCSVISTGTGVAGSSNNIGGFAGSITTGTIITDCYSKTDVSVSGSADNAAGFIGYIVTSDCQVVTSFARGDITNSSSSFNRIGGFAGMNTGTITNCYSTGNVQSAGADYGGFAGYTGAGSVITNCYSVGVLTGSGTNDGGFIGAYVAGSFTSCYWLQDGAINFGLTDAGSGSPANINNRTQAQLKTQATFFGWDFITIPVWDISAGYYPYMIYESWDFPN